MFIDSQAEFSADQALTATAVSTNVLDAGADLGAGRPIHILTQVTEDFAAVGAATLTVALQDSDDAAFSAPRTLISGSAVAKASLTAGHRFGLGVLPADHKRYLRLNYTVATGPFTAGKIEAGLVIDLPTNG